MPADVDLRADRDDALDLVVRGLLEGRDPWAVPTQIDESHHPSPGLGGALLALPFVTLLGDSSWQNLFWLVLAGGLLIRLAGPASGVAAGLLLVASPIFANEWWFQSDIFTLGCKFAVAMLWGLRAMSSPNWIPWCLSALLLSAVLTDRFVFLPLALVVAVVALRFVPWRRAVAWLAVVAGLTALLMIVPWLTAPEYGAQILRNLTKASSDVIPQAGYLFAVLVVVVAVVGAFRVGSDAGVLGAAAGDRGRRDLLAGPRGLVGGRRAPGQRLPGDRVRRAFLALGVGALTVPPGSATTLIDYRRASSP